MDELVERHLNSHKNKTIDTLEMEKWLKKELKNEGQHFDYRQFAEKILSLSKTGEIEPVKSSGETFMIPSLHKKYRKKEKPKERLTASVLLTVGHPKMNLNYYRERADEYRRDKEVLEAITRFLYQQESDWMTVNERSFELLGNEKYLDSQEGKRLLQIIEISLEDMRCEKTYEPFFYHRLSSDIQNILIIENKDTFSSIKKLMNEGLNTFYGISYQLLIYGEGRKILRSIEYLNELNIPLEVAVHYFGDIDREGLWIKHRLELITDRGISYATDFYREAIKTGRSRQLETKQTENKDANCQFQSHLVPEEWKFVEKVLREGRIIPQEAVNQKILRRTAQCTPNLMATVSVSET